MVSFFLSSGWSEMMVAEENIIRLSVFLSVIHHILNRMNNIGIVLYFLPTIISSDLQMVG